MDALTNRVCDLKQTQAQPRRDFEIIHNSELQVQNPRETNHDDRVLKNV